MALIAGGDTVLVTATEVSNPPAASTGDVVTVSTSSDTVSAQTSAYAITAGLVGVLSVGRPVVDIGAGPPTSRTTSASPPRRPERWRRTTRRSRLAAPAGTNFTSNTTYTVEDLTTGSQCGYYNAVTNNGGATVVLSTSTGCGTIAGGDTVLVTASLVTNPSASSTGNFLTVSTSSDTTAVHTNTYAITAAAGGLVAVGHALDGSGRGDERHLHHVIHHLVDRSIGAVLLDDHLGRPVGDRLHLEQLHD